VIFSKGTARRYFIRCMRLRTSWPWIKKTLVINIHCKAIRLTWFLIPMRATGSLGQAFHWCWHGTKPKWSLSYGLMSAGDSEMGRRVGQGSFAIGVYYNRII
jgi:hypothetical protein